MKSFLTVLIVSFVAFCQALPLEDFDVETEVFGNKLPYHIDNQENVNAFKQYIDSTYDDLILTEAKLVVAWMSNN